MVFINTESVGC